MRRELIAEALGSFILVLVICGTAIASVRLQTGDSDLLAVSLGAGLALAVVYYLFAPISGGHFNPALSLASWLKKQISGRQAFAFCIAQVLGGAAGATSAFLILSLQPGFQPLEFAANGYGKHSPGGYPLTAVFLIEFLFTALFALVFLRLKPARENSALVLGVTYCAAHLATGAISGTSLNPARSTAAALFAEGWAIDQLWVFWLAPLCGATVAAILSKYFATDNNA